MATTETMNGCSVPRPVCDTLTRGYTYKDAYANTLSWCVDRDAGSMILHRGEVVSLKEALRRVDGNEELMRSLEDFQLAKHQLENYWVSESRRHPDDTMNVLSPRRRLDREAAARRTFQP